MQQKRRVEHMLRRRATGMTYKEMSDEFQMSPQHIGSLVRKHGPKITEKEEDEE